MGKTVFIIDDSITVRVAVKTALQKAGHEVYDAKDGLDALNKLKDFEAKKIRLNLIITDINMPNMDGITFIIEAKKMMTFKFVPILVLTTESQESMKLKGKQAGATGWLVKPFTAEQLADIVAKVAK